MDALRRFREIWAVDTEFRRSPGGLPDPVCCVCAVELRTGREVQIWTEHGAHQPFDTGPSNLFVAQYSSAEWLSFIVLGWATAGLCRRHLRRGAGADQWPAGPQGQR